jgi:hypothetical protein
MFRESSKVRVVLGGLVLGAAALTFPGLALAQEGGVTVSGTATAEDGSPLQYVVVGFPEQEAFGLSNADGSWSIEGVTPGVYRFVALRRGFYYADTFVEITGPASLEIVLVEEDPDDPVALGRLTGQYLDQESGDPVRDVELRLQPMGLTTSTDRQGRFSFGELTIGAVLLEASRMGYQARADTLAVAPDITLNATVYLQPDAVTLEPIVVEVTALNRFLEINGFYRRQQSSRQGTVITREEIERRNPPFISQMLNTVMGTRLQRDNFGTMSLRSTRDGCELTVWLDGMRVPGFDMDTYPVDAIEAVEVWRGQSVPPEFRDPCGVVLIWSRRP